MKKCLILAAIILSFAVIPKTMEAQSYNSALNTTDTLTNSDTIGYSSTISGNKAVITYQVDVTKISGTVAGTIVVSALIGTSTNYYAIASDTLTNTTGTKAYSYSFVGNKYTKYKITITTSGTCSASYVAYLMYR